MPKYIDQSSETLRTSACPARFQQLSLQDLGILDIKSLPADSPLWEWPGMRSIFVAESCARTLFVGSADMLRKQIHEDVIKTARRNRSGEDAYEYLLRVVTGLESKNRGEYDILRQFRARWQDYQENFPEANPSLSRLIQWILADAKLVRENAFRGLHPISEMRSAVELAGLRGGETILLIADKLGITEETLLALGKATRTQAAQVYITHKEDSELQERAREANGLRSDKKIHCEIAPVDFHTLMEEGLDAYDHVFVCAPMAPNGCAPLSEQLAFDHRIIELWKSRKRQDGHIVHVKGDPFARGDTSSHWNCLLGSGLLTPNDIRRRFMGERKKVQDMFELAETIIKNCIYSRKNGENPIKKIITTDPVFYAEYASEHRRLSTAEDQKASR